MLENHLLCRMVRLDVVLHRQPHHLAQGKNLGMFAGAGVMHRLRPLPLLDELHIGLAAHRACRTAVQHISSQPQLRQYPLHQLHMERLAAVGGHQKGQLPVSKAVFLQPAVLHKGQGLKRLGGTAPEHRQPAIAGFLQDITLAVDCHHIGTMDILHMACPRVLQNNLTHKTYPSP